MVREPEEYTPREHPPEPPGVGERPAGTRREHLDPDEARRIAREQGRLISSGRARKGRIVLTTPLRRWIFVGALVALVLIALLSRIALPG